jgi:uncharacterized protein YgbK (DUF1537 family)
MPAFIPGNIFKYPPKVVKRLSHNKKPIIGCVADDFTGASDIASFFVKGGLSTVLYNGIPQAETDKARAPQAMVIALKSRTIPAKDAVAQSLSAFDWLKAQGARQLYFKYCSTFDSTRKGNIGPVSDAVLEKYGIPFSILCPALPVNGRVVRHGQLLVNGIPLHQSSMGNHPLTPMWDSSICNLMKAQSAWPCISMNRRELMCDDTSVSEYLSGLQEKHARFYIVPDCETPEDARCIVRLFGKLPFLTGGSGIAQALASSWLPDSRDVSAGKQVLPLHADQSRCLILAGSCSEATRGQVTHFINAGGVSLKIVPRLLVDGHQTVEGLSRFIKNNRNRDIMLYSSDEPYTVAKNQKLGKERIAKLIEGTFAQTTQAAVGSGFRRIIVAGGETAGAVIQTLGYSGFLVGQAVAPGVPVMTPIEAPDIRMVLKSGNFGEVDFFTKAACVMRTPNA